MSHQVRVTKFSDEEWSDTVLDHEIEDFLDVTGPTTGAVDGAVL